MITVLLNHISGFLSSATSMQEAQWEYAAEECIAFGSHWGIMQHLNHD